MSVSMAPEDVTGRLLEASRATDLSPASRLDQKIDLSQSGVTARLREASDLLALCQKLRARFGPPDSAGE